MLSGLVMVLEHQVSPWAFALGAVVVLACLLWLTVRRLLALGLMLVLNRCFLLLVFSSQLYLIFKALGSEVSLIGAAYYSLASVVGTIVPFFPSGLGVSEVAGAALARMIGESAALVFLAIGINRMIGLAFCGLISLAGIRYLAPPEKN